MSLNMIRKGVAVAAAASLATLGLSAPAQAAGELKLEAASGGAVYSVLHTSDFALKASVNPGYDTSELAFLKYKITSGGGFEVDAGAGDTEAAAIAALADGVVAVADASDNVAGSWAAGDAAATFVALHIDKLDDNTAFAVTDASKTVTVTAYIDKDGDSVVDANEWQTSQVVTWKDSDLASVTNVLDTTRGAQPFSTITSTDINLSQSKSVIDVDFTDDAPDTEKVVATASVYSTTKDTLTFTTDDVEPDGGDAASGVKASAAGDVFTSVAVIGAVEISNKVTTTVLAATIDEVEYTADASANNVALADNGANMNAKVGSGTITLNLVTELANVAVKDSAVAVKVAENAATLLDPAASVSFGGVTLTNTSDATVQSKTATVTSNALGKASITLSYSGVTKNDKLTVTLTGDGNAPSFTIPFVEAAATTLLNTDVIGTAAELVKPAATDFTLSYAVLDQFGALFSAAGHSVAVNDDADAATFTGAVVNGKATVSIPAYAAGSTPGTMDAEVLKGVAATGVVTTTELTIGTETAVASVAIAGSYGTAAAPLALNTKAFAAGDNRNGAADATVQNEIADLAVTVKDANGNATTSVVTLAGADLLFSVDGIVWAEGSVTVRTKSDGTTTAGYVKVSSNKTGKKTMTVTAGGVSKTQAIYFAAAADDAGKTLTINAPDNVSPGTTLKITGSLVDAFGNPVTADGTDEDFILTYSGPGYAGAVPTAISADGTFTYNVLLGAGDSGTATITAAYDLDEDGDYTDTGDIVTTKTVTVGAAPAAADTKVNAGSFKGYVAIYAKGHEGKRLSAKVGNDWVVVPVLASNFERVVEYTGAGYTIAVRIYIDRVLVDTITVTTK